MLGPAGHRGKDTWRPCAVRVRGPNNVGRTAKTDPTLLHFASAIAEQKKCWELLVKSLTTPSNKPQHANGRNM